VEREDEANEADGVECGVVAVVYVAHGLLLWVIIA